MTNSASARALAVRLRTTSTWRRAHRDAAQQRQHRADHELGLGARARGQAADDLDLALLARFEVDVLGAGADAADRAQHGREVERLGVDRDRGRHDRGADVVERAAQLARREGELGSELEAVARRQPTHDVGIDRVDDEQVHRGPFFAAATVPVPEWGDFRIVSR